MKLTPLLLLLIIIFSQANAQNETTSFYWTRYYQELTKGDFKLETEVDNRRYFSLHSQRQFITRTTFLYEIVAGLNAGLGLSYARELNKQSNLFIPEWRPHQQVEFDHGNRKLHFNHRLRTEQMFIRKAYNEILTDEYNFTFRIRYRLLATVDLIKKEESKGYLGVQFRTESFFTKDSKWKMSEYRFYGGTIFQPFENTAFELGYMWLHQLNKDQKDNLWNVFRLTIRHYLKLS